jgi:hypothetical protein
MDIRSQLVLGIQRVEQAFLLMGLKECNGMEKAGEMGSGASNLRATQSMGREAVGWSKPKKKNFKGIIKSQQGLLGPKPNMTLIQASKGPGDKNGKKPSKAGSKASLKPVQGQVLESTKHRQDPKPRITLAQAQHVSDSTKLEQHRSSLATAGAAVEAGGGIIGDGGRTCTWS